MKRAAEDLRGHPAHPAERQAAQPRVPDPLAAPEASLEATGVSGFPIGIFDSASEFSIGGRSFIRLGASAAKCLALNCTTRGGHTFNGKGYAALPLSQHAQACVRAEATARSRNEARQQQREQSKADKESAKAEDFKAPHGFGRRSSWAQSA